MRTGPMEGNGRWIAIRRAGDRGGSGAIEVVPGLFPERERDEIRPPPQFSTGARRNVTCPSRAPVASAAAPGRPSAEPGAASRLTGEPRSSANLGLDAGPRRIDPAACAARVECGGAQHPEVVARRALAGSVRPTSTFLPGSARVYQSPAPTSTRAPLNVSIRLRATPAAPAKCARRVVSATAAANWVPSGAYGPAIPSAGRRVRRTALHLRSRGGRPPARDGLAAPRVLHERGPGGRRAPAD